MLNLTKYQKAKTKLNKLYRTYIRLNQNNQNPEKLEKLITKISNLEAKLIKYLQLRYKITKNKIQYIP